MNRRSKILIPLMLMSGILFGQNELDALRFSKTRPFGTGLALGTSGALGAVGADMGAVSVNPAGLGFYRQGEFNISLGLFNPQTNTEYLGYFLSDNMYGFTVPNLSYVTTKLFFDKGKEPEDELVSYSFSFQLNRNYNFYNKSFYQGRNTGSSFLDAVWERSEGYFLDELGSLEWLAYQTYLLNPLDPDVQNDQWDIPLGGTARDVGQTGIIETRGGLFDWNVGGGFNFGNKFYGGLSLHYHRLRMNEVNTFREDNNGSPNGFQSMDFVSNVRSRGGGLGVKIGGVFRPVEDFRLGLSFHSPVKMTINDEYFYEMSSSFAPTSPFAPPQLNNNARDPDTERYPFKYHVTTPARFTLSAAYVTGRFGFLSLDVERVNYAAIGMGSEFDNYLVENTRIKSDFRNVTNVRLGAEILAGDVRLRGGLAHYASPYRKEIEEYKGTNSEWNLSGGIGIRKKKYGFDIGVMQTKYRDLYVPYMTTDPDYPSSTVVRKHKNIAITASLIFFIDPD